MCGLRRCLGAFQGWCMLQMPFWDVSQAVGVVFDEMVGEAGMDQQLPCARGMSTRDRSCIKRPDYVFVFETHVVS